MWKFPCQSSLQLSTNAMDYSLRTQHTKTQKNVLTKHYAKQTQEKRKRKTLIYTQN